MKAGIGLHMWLMRFIKTDFIRFVVGGITNTFSSYIIYLLLAYIIPYKLAYIASYVMGVVFSYFINAKFVFRRPITLRSMLKFPYVYIVQLIASYVLLHLLVEILGLGELYAPIIIIIITVPLTFFLTRFIFYTK